MLQLCTSQFGYQSRGLGIPPHFIVAHSTFDVWVEAFGAGLLFSFSFFLNDCEYHVVLSDLENLARSIDTHSHRIVVYYT